MDPPGGWNLRSDAQPVSYYDARTGQIVSGSFDTAVKSELDQSDYVILLRRATLLAAVLLLAEWGDGGSGLRQIGGLGGCGKHRQSRLHG